MIISQNLSAHVWRIHIAVIALSYHSGTDKQAPDSMLLGKAGI